MVRETPEHIGQWKTSAKGHLSIDKNGDEKTDYSRWRLEDERGRQVWRYLESDEENERWPQTVYEKHFLGLDTGLPDSPPAKTPLQAAHNGLSFLSQIQLPSGQWASECNGPMFMLPCVIIACYVTHTPIPPEHAVEIKRYLFARQHPEDGGWGWHLKGHSSNMGTTLNYVTLRLLGASSDDPRMVQARKCLHSIGGALYGPGLSKFWLSVLGVMRWEGVNPFLPEVWLAPDSDPTAPWKWYVHTRTSFLPMSYLWSKKWSYAEDVVTRSLRSELYTQPYETINFAVHRDSIAGTDNDVPKSWVVNLINWIIIWLWIPLFRWSSLIKRAESRVWELVQAEDKNTDYLGLSPVSKAMHLIICYIHDGKDSDSVWSHRETMLAYFWMKDEGMLCNLSDGIQVWDTSLTVQAVEAAGLANDSKYQPTVVKAHEFLEDHQLRENVANQANCYREHRKGGWPFSTRYQGYMVSECTAEALRSTIQLQEIHSFPKLISIERLRDSVDCLLLMQNASGGFCVYEKRRGSPNLEWLEAGEFGGKMMVSYEYVECTAAVVTALSWFGKFYPKYRANEMELARVQGLKSIKQSQNQDGGWCASWGICFTYGAMWALEALALNGETFATCEYSRRGCEFIISKQREDGGWGESYLSCEKHVYIHHEDSQVVQTAWACLALMQACYPHKAPITKGIRLIMSRQQSQGQWLQEDLEGSLGFGVISYSNYKLFWPVRAFGQYVRKYGNENLL